MGYRFPILIALGLAIPGCASQAAPANLPERVPAIELQSVAGDRTAVARLADGRVALVSLWATWCDACNDEMAALNRLAAKTAAGRDAVVIGVDEGEDPKTVIEFAQRRGLKYALLVDQDFAFADALGQRRVPSTLVVDRAGRIVFQGEKLDEKSLDALRRAIAVAH